MMLVIRLLGHELLAIGLSDDDDERGASDALADRVPLGFVLPERDGGAPELVDHGTHRE